MYINKDVTPAVAKRQRIERAIEGALKLAEKLEGRQ